VKVVRRGRTVEFGEEKEEVKEDKKEDKKKGKKDDNKPEGEDSEPEIVLTGTMDCAPLAAPGQQLVHLTTRLLPADAEDVRVSGASAVAELKFHLSAPLVDVPDTKLEILNGMGQVVGMRQWKPKEKPRDVAGELRRAVEDIAERLAAEMGDADEQTLYEKVQASGLFYDMKETLRPAVQLAAHSRFRKAPKDVEAYRSELFTALSSQLNSVLINKFTSNTAVDSELFPTPADSFAKDFEMYGMRAEEAAAAGRMDIAMSRHEDRVALGEKASKTGDAFGLQMLSDAWDAMAKFCLVSNLPGARDRALECVKKAAEVGPLSLELQLLNALAQLDFGMYDLAEASFKAALGVAEGIAFLPLQRSKKAIIYAGMCVLNDAIDELEKKTYDADKESLRQRGLPMVTFPKRDLSRCIKAKESLKGAAASVDGAPDRRAGLVAMLSVAEIMLDLNLPVAAKRALDLAAKCEALAAKKEQERELEATNVASVYGLRSRLDACLALVTEGAAAALPFAAEAARLDGTGRNYEVLGQANSQGEAVDAYEKSLEAFRDDAPLRIYLKLALLLIEQQTEEALSRAKEVSLTASKKFGSAMAWRLAGITLGELGNKVEAEAVFQESLRINSFDPLTWANLALLTLDGEGRIEDSVASAKQSILHDLDDAFLLRQLGSKLYGRGELPLAELMLRRSLVLNAAGATKKMLGDVLRASKKPDEAVAFFLEVMEDPAFNFEEKCELFKVLVSIYGERGGGKGKELADFKRKYADYSNNTLR